MRIDRLAVGVLLALLTLPGPAAAQVAPGAYDEILVPPDGAAGDRIAELIAQINTGDPETNAEWATRWLDAGLLEDGPAPHVEQWGFIRTLRGPVSFHCQRVYADGPPAPIRGEPHIVVLHGEANDDWLAMAIGIDPAPPHRVLSLMFTPARPPLDTLDRSAIAASELAGVIDELVDTRAARSGFSGTVLVARGSEVVASASAGYRTDDTTAPIGRDTRFHIASVGKMLTATVAERLIERGDLDRDAGIGRYLPPGTVDRATGERVTVDDLLRHTGGFGDFYSSLPEDVSPTDLDGIADIVEALGTPIEPESDPGRWRYSNTGYVLLGAVLEGATDTPYEQLMARELFEPAGMPSAGFDRHDAPLGNRAVGYLPMPDGQLLDARPFWPARGTPAGGAYASVDDLWAFARALLDGTLVSSATLTEMSRATEGSAYGAGLMLWPGDREGPGAAMGHTGGIEGGSAVVTIHPQSEWVVIVLSNRPTIALDMHSRVVSTLGRLER